MLIGERLFTPSSLESGKMNRFLLSVLIACFGIFYSLAAQAQLEIDITEGNVSPVPIAIPDFSTTDHRVGTIGSELAEVIRNNLDRSGLFKSLDPRSFIETLPDINYRPNFSDWRVIKAEALVSGRIVMEDANRIRVEFRLWDVYRGEQLDALRFSTTTDNWRRIAHKVSDGIYEKLTGESGYFDSRIVFIDESGPKTNRIKKLAIMDQDGANLKYIRTGSDLVLTPRYDHKAQKITFLSYENVLPQVYLLNIESSQRELLGTFQGMTFAPRFSPDGRSMIFSLMSKDNSDVYRRDLTSQSSQRLTTSPAIDVSASFSPDGRQIVFNSDRGGSPQLYVMNANGGATKRISFGKGRYSAPVWSPRGDKIAFVKSLDGKFSIGVMDPDGSGERLLTESFLDEGPTWSPNGRVIAFSRQARGSSGKNELWSVDLSGRNLRKIPTPGSASDPAWSPILE